MPKKLEELKGFVPGIISSPSSLDIPKEAATYSLNIDSKKEQGALSGIYEPKVLSPDGWRDKRFTKWSLKFKAHASTFNIDKYENKYIILHAYKSVYLVWFSSASNNLFSSLNLETED